MWFEKKITSEAVETDLYQEVKDARDMIRSIRGMEALKQRDYSGQIERTRIQLRRTISDWKRPTTERNILRAWRVILAISVEIRKNNNPARLKNLRAELLKITRR